MKRPSMWTHERNELMRKRFPSEGSSESLCQAIGLRKWQVIAQASRLGLKVLPLVKKYNRVP